MSDNKKVVGSLGALRPKFNIKDYKFRPAKVTPHAASFAKDISKTHVKDQGKINSCVPSSLTYTPERYTLKQNGIDEEFSIGLIYGYRPSDYNQTEGMYMRDALKTLQTIGNVPKSLFDYNEEVPYIIDRVNGQIDNLKPLAYPNRISTYFALEDDDAIKTYLETMDDFVHITVDWYDDCEYDGAVCSDGTVRTIINKGTVVSGAHALTIYGWNEFGWLVLNTWGTDFCQNGTAIIPYDYGLNEAWGTTDEINITVNDDSPVIVKPKRNAFLDIIYNIVNFIVNLFKKK